MTSAIDPTKPTTGTATTESVRQNFSTAKTEIEDLQAAIISETINRNAAITAEVTARNTAIDNAIAEEVTARNAAIAASTAGQLPVGSIYLSAIAGNPASLLGYGTWAAIAAGRVLVGLDAAQAEFNALGKTGGAKTHTLTTAEIPSHNHTQNAHNHTQDAHNHTQNPHRHNMVGDTFTSGSGVGGRNIYPNTTTNQTLDTTATNNATTATNQATTATNNPTGGGGAHNNLQPYFVVNIWQRTA